jgi:hypothetical protein
MVDPRMLIASGRLRAVDDLLGAVASPVAVK